MPDIILPNRPVGTQNRNVNEMLGNFDHVLEKLLELDALNLNGTAVSEAKFDGELAKKLGMAADGRVASVYGEVLTAEATSLTTTTGVDLATVGPSVLFDTTAPCLTITLVSATIAGNGAIGWRPLGNVNYLNTFQQNFAPCMIYETGNGGNGQTHRMKYKSNDGTSVTFSNRRIRVISFSL